MGYLYPKMIAIPVFSCLNIPGPGDENAVRLSLASMILPTVAAEISALLGEVSIRSPKEAKVEGFLALAAVVVHPVAGGHCCFPVATGCPANGYGQMNRKLGCLAGFFLIPESNRAACRRSTTGTPGGPFTRSWRSLAGVAFLFLDPH